MMMTLCVAFTSLPSDAAVYAGAADATEVVVESTEEEDTADEPQTQTEGTEITESGETDGTESTEIETEVIESNETENVVTESTETETIETESTGQQKEDANTEETETVTEDTELPEQSTEEASGESETEEIETEETEEVTEEEAEESEVADLNFVMVESSEITTPGTQNIVASVGTEEMELENPVLLYKNLTTGKEYRAKAVARAQDMMLFAIEFLETADSGEYQLVGISYQKDGREYQIEMSGLEMDVRFGVNTSVETEPDQVLVEEAALADVDAQVVTMDENGEVISENTVEDVLNNGIKSKALAKSSMLKRASGNLVVVLDPGHDNTHAGASYYGAQEQELVLKIAQFCREELNTYDGVNVYMVRESNDCPYGGSSVTSGTCNKARVEYAKSVGADVYVSFHLNASTSSSANGVGVYYPNGNYNAQIGEEGKGLATTIYNKLTALGLQKWSDGVIVWNANYDKYPDGSAADYLSVIRNSKLAGIPAVLIEHAFLSGTSDFNNFLNSDEKLKTLGVADATAIAEYYGLQKKSAEPLVGTSLTSVVSYNSTALKITWKKINGVYGYYIKRSTSKDGTYKKIQTIRNGNTTSYIDEGVETGKTYYYKIETIARAGSKFEYSGDSEPMAGKTAPKTKIDYVVSSGSTAMSIGWEEVAGSYGYRVKRSTTKGGTYKHIATVKGAANTTYRDTGLKAGKTYYYRIETINRVNSRLGYSGDSTLAYATTLKDTTITTATALNSSTMRLAWKKVSGATGYQVYRSTSKNGTYSMVGTVTSGGITAYRDKGLTAGKTYYYKVRAIKKGRVKTGVGSYSKVVKTWTLKKASISSVSGVGRQITIQWNKVSNAEGYTVYRKKSTDKSYKKIATISSSNKLSYKDTTADVDEVYLYRIVANGKILGSATGRSDYSDPVRIAPLARARMYSVGFHTQGEFSLAWKEVANADGYQVAYSLNKNSGFRMLKRVSGTRYIHENIKDGNTYYYKVRAYTRLSDNSIIYGNWSVIKSRAAAHEIMGSSNVTVAQMTAYYDARYTFPASVYKNKGASTSKQFFTILKEEAEAEGVKTEVVFAQVMLETGGLQFGGDVSASQCNFGGLGATGGGAAGETFANVRIGLRAQVQHLKAYASTKALNQGCVDTRFQYVTRGCAPYVEWLAIPQNPYGKGWAADADYGNKLIRIMNSL